MSRESSANVYFGSPSRQLAIAGFAYSERVYEPSARLPRHSHALASLCLVLAGSYDETYGMRVRACAPGAIVYHPPGEVHSDRHGEGAVRLLCVDLEEGRLKTLRPVWPLIDAPCEVPRGAATRLGARLYQEFRSDDPFAPLAIEGITLEILAETSRATRQDAKPPAWLVRAEGLLREGFRTGLSVGEIADAVGVHPVHFARAFRQHFRCGPAEFARTLRVEEACRRLSHTGDSLAEVALETGFADQSHLTRALRARVGMTPGEYRRTFASY